MDGLYPKLIEGGSGPADTRRRRPSLRLARRRASGVALCWSAMACQSTDEMAARDSVAHVVDSIAISRADSAARAHQDSITRAQPGYVVDSMRPIAEELRRFREGLIPVAVLESDARSRDALVAGLVRAVESSDTTMLRRLALTRAEFAFLVYPSSPYVRPPYRQSPEIRWMLMGQESSSGLARLLRRLGGRSLTYAGHECGGAPTREGKNLFWTNCQVRVAFAGRAEQSLRLFPAIIQRDGRWKIVSYANDF